MPEAADRPDTTSTKRVLLLATTHWISTARLAMSLSELGCRVELMAPKEHPAMLTGVLAARHPYWPMRPIRSLRRALAASRPDLLVFADELSFLLVERLADWAMHTESEEATATLALLRRSFGSVECLPLTRSRIALLSAASAAGAPVPLSVGLRSEDDVQRVAREIAGPWMLKADATWGGFGVRQVDEPARLNGAWRRLQQPLDLPRSLKRGWSGKEWGHLHLWLRGDRRDVMAQSFIRGRERTGMAVCNRGRVVAAVCLEVEEVRYKNGPSSMLRVVQDDAMLDAMHRTAEALGISGFCGFDFMLEEDSGERYLLEMNMRPTQLAHLPLGVGQDLCAALVREVLGVAACADRDAVTETGLVAMFPQEILRDPTGSRLRETFHDVPWAAPQLMELAMRPAKLPALLTGDVRWCGAREDASRSQAGVLTEDHA